MKEYEKTDLSDKIGSTLIPVSRIRESLVRIYIGLHTKDETSMTT